jgi:DNA-binding SARP family transcriptional activator
LAGIYRLRFAAKEAIKGMINNTLRKVHDKASELLVIAKSGQCVPWQVTAHFLMAYWSEAMNDKEHLVAHLSEGLKLLDSIGWMSYPYANDPLTGFVFVKSVRYNILPEIADRLVKGEARVDLLPAFKLELSDDRLSAEELERLVQAALDADIRGLSSSLKKLAQMDDSGSIRAIENYCLTVSSSPLPPLQVRSLGHFSVTIASKEIAFPRPVIKHLFQILLCFHPNPVHEELLLEELWPYADPLKTRSRLHVYVSQLRRTLNEHSESQKETYIECRGNQYSINFPVGSFFDVLEFESNINNSQPLSYSDPAVADVFSAKCSALRLYRGDFLSERPFDKFCVFRRQELREKFQSAALHLSASASEGTHHLMISNVLKMGLRTDPLWRDGVKQLMTILVKNGQLVDALRLYREFEKQIHRELDLPPDEELRAYFDNLVTPS